MKVMRKALAMLVDACVSFHHFVENGLDGHYEAIPHYDSAAEDFLRFVDFVKSALSAPPRNCDVGTPDEQAKRFEDFCLEHIGCAEQTGGRHCVGCPLVNASKNVTQECGLYWAQMPYEKGCAE